MKLLDSLESLLLLELGDPMDHLFVFWIHCLISSSVFFLIIAFIEKQIFEENAVSTSFEENFVTFHHFVVNSKKIHLGY